MAEIRSFGVQSIKMGNVGSTGGMGTSLTDIGKIVKDSCDLVMDDPQINDIMSEQSDDPEEVIIVKGVTSLKFSVMDMTPTVLQKLLGGTVSGTAPNDSWNAPDTAPDIEQSIEITTKTGAKIQIARAKVVGKINYQFRRNDVLKVDVTCRILQPTDGTTKAIVITPVPA